MGVRDALSTQRDYGSGACAVVILTCPHLPRLPSSPPTRSVQFDRQELGVEMVRDTDLMPASPAENLPPAQLRGRPCLLLNGRSIINGQPVQPLPPAVSAGAAAAAAAAAAALPAAVGVTPLGSAAAAGLLPPGIKQEDGGGAAGGAVLAGQQQARAADAKALAEVRRRQWRGSCSARTLMPRLVRANPAAAAALPAPTPPHRDPSPLSWWWD